MMLLPTYMIGFLLENCNIPSRSPDAPAALKPLPQMNRLLGKVLRTDLSPKFMIATICVRLLNIVVTPLCRRFTTS